LEKMPFEKTIVGLAYEAIRRERHRHENCIAERKRP